VNRPEEENNVQPFRIGIGLLLAALIGMLFGIWNFGFSLFMHAEDLGDTSHPELVDQLLGIPPQTKSLMIAALVGAGLCVLLLVGSYVYPRRSRRHPS
jgi:hypothetical protein